MCQNSGSNMQSEQIQKYVENGMPQKIVKTVQYTLRKRAKERSVSNVAFPDTVETLGVPSLITAVSSSSSSPSTSCEFSSKPSQQKQLLKEDSTVSSEQRASAISISQTAAALKIPKLCGRFRQMQQRQDKIANIGGITDDLHTDEDAKVYVDALAIATQMTKQYVQRLSCMAAKLQDSKLYTLLTKTAQPAHVIAVCILSFVLITVWPEVIESKKAAAATAADGSHIDLDRVSHPLAVMAYLGAFATHFGSQIWMTFVSGLSLYFSLPRHTFGQCQQILFPKYFALNGVLSICMLVLFAKYFLGNWSAAGLVQLSALALSAAIEITVRLYLAPPMLRLMHEKYRIEGAVGSGQEVGGIEQGDLVQCPHYQRIHKAFRRIHMTIAMGNMTVLLATCLHLYFLASKIQIS